MKLIECRFKLSEFKKALKRNQIVALVKMAGQNAPEKVKSPSFFIENILTEDETDMIKRENGEDFLHTEKEKSERENSTEICTG